MSSKQNEQQQQQQLYRSFSRKQLQTWCKKLGLPARKSSSVMAESLLSYFQKNGTDLTTSGKSFNEYQEILPPMSLVPSHPPEAPLYLTENALEGCTPRYCHRDEGGEGNGIVHFSELETFGGHQVSGQGGFDSVTNSFLEASGPLSGSQCAGCGFSHKESLSSRGRFEDIPQSNCIGIDGDTSTRRSDGHPIKGPGSFEFYVGSEEGIKLCVDLNSRTYEWIKNCSDQVYLLNNLHKSHSLHLDLGSVGESSRQRGSTPIESVELGPAMDNCVQGPSLSSALEKCPSVVDHPDVGKQSLMASLSILQSSAQEASECLGDDQGRVSFEPSLDMLSQSVSKNVVYSNKLELNINPDPNVTDMPTEKTACNFAVNSTSDGLVDRVAVEYSKQDDEACENSILQNGIFTENASFAFQNSLASRSMEMQLSEAGNYHEDASCSPYENCKFLDLIDSQHSMENDQDALPNSRENNICGIHLPTSSEERELSNNANGRESSVCSQVDESYAKLRLKSAAAVSNQKGYRQELNVGKESENGGSRYEARVLRSTTRSTRVHPRRSMRLVTKQT